MIEALLSAIAKAPALALLLEKLIAWIANGLEQAKKKRASLEVGKAIETAQKAKDTSSLDQFLDPERKK
jgi:hypothetical protein